MIFSLQVITIQCSIRCFLAKKSAARKRLLRDAPFRVTSFARMVIAQSRTKHLKIQFEAAIKIQNVVRGYLARRAAASKRQKQVGFFLYMIEKKMH